MGNRFALLIVSALASIGSTFGAEAESPTMKRWVLSEAHPDGSRTLVVVDEDLRFRNDPRILSQEVILRRRFTPDEAEAFASESARYANEAPAIPESEFSTRAGRPLWTAVKDEWTPEDEDAYSELFGREVDKDFLKGTGLLADCADVGLVFRWVYAREHRLPIANTLIGSGKLLGNFTGSEAWDALPTHANWRRDERFKAALRALFEQTFTHTISEDQYPTEITRRYVRAGSMYMAIHQTNGHTQTFKEISDRGYRIYYGNMPAAETIYNTNWLSVGAGRSSGYRNWRHVRRSVVQENEVWTLVPGTEMPGYSTEQYETPWGYADPRWVLARLGYQFSDEDRFLVYLKEFASLITYRRQVTGVGTLYCGPSSPCPATGENYDAYSTFSRDARLKDLRSEARALLALLGGTANPKVATALNDLGKQGEVISGLGFTLVDVLLRDGIIETWSSDPNVSFLARWGWTDSVSEDLAFRGASTAFLETLRIRTRLVESAWIYCEGEFLRCWFPNASIRALKTSELDVRIARAHSVLSKLARRAGVDAATRLVERERYRGLVLQYAKSDRCAVKDKCTADDVIWAPGAGTRVRRWAHKPRNSTAARWRL